jgi:hypothetical protein
MVTGSSVYFLHHKCFLLSLVKISGSCCEASINLANRARSIQPCTRTTDIDTAKMATPEHLEKESGMLIYGGQMEDNKYTAFGPSHQEWPRGSEEMSVSALLDLV